VAQKSDKMTKQELRAPDAFQLYGAEVSDWLSKRSQYISTALTLLVVGGLIAALVNYFTTRGEEQASKQLGAALQVLERPVEGAQQPLPAPGDEPPFKSQQEKDEAVRKALTDFRAQHKGTDAAVTAALPLGKAEYRLGNHDGAVAALSEFVKEAEKNDPLLASAHEGLGYAHEAKGNLEQAFKSFEDMGKVEGEFLKGMGRYHQARILVQQGKKDEAARMLADLKSAQPESAAGRLATERLAVLAAQGVKVPEPKAPAAQQQDAG
jgi:tetratricopeptide (TPR) repeat protein